MLGGDGVPEFDLRVLSAGGEERLRRVPGEAIGAVIVAGEIGAGAVGGGEERDRAGGRGGGEGVGSGAGGTGYSGPAEVDHIIVELRGPVLGELHESAKGTSGAAARKAGVFLATEGVLAKYTSPSLTFCEDERKAAGPALSSQAGPLARLHTRSPWPSTLSLSLSGTVYVANTTLPYFRRVLGVLPVGEH